MARKFSLLATLLFAGPGCMLCDRYCERQRDRCQQYYAPPPNCTPAQAPAFYPPNHCQPAVGTTGSYYPQPVNPHCP